MLWQRKSNGKAAEGDGIDPEEAERLKARALTLKIELAKINEALNRTGENTAGAVENLAPPAKSGYLFKWQDRSIGWGGTKWALRFVNLDRGRISYYGSHLENSARYVLSLRGCAVRDEGWKRNRRNSTWKYLKDKKEPPLDQAGAYFFVFSIYHFDSSVDNDTSSEIVPLLRFSTPSLAEKTQWIQLISEACAYCETDNFLKEEAARNVQEESRRQQQLQLAQAMPQAERGTLPPLFFANAEKFTPMKKRKSLSRVPNSKLFRSTSNSRDADKSEKKGYPPSKPMHRSSAPSYLSVEAESQNYRGFFNLAMIVLVVSNFRLILNSVRKYGFVLLQVQNVSEYSLRHWDQFPFLSGMLVLLGSLVCAFVIEWMLGVKRLYEPVGMILHHINAHSGFAMATYITWVYVANPVYGGCLMLNAAIVWMKTVSYFHANQDYRLNTNAKSKDTMSRSFQNLSIVESLDQEDSDMAYPRNVTLGNMLYFWFAPTLTYQLAFPKSPRVRKGRVIGILARMVVVVCMYFFLVAQTVTPTLDNLMRDLDASNGRYSFGLLADYWLRLGIPNTYLWLMTFYFYFHLYLNLCAELLRFGDRVFYKDWWNSGEVSAYWRLWNIPVHYWLVRHLYFPCVRAGASKSVATLAVFTFSAVMHEVLISIPFHLLRPWSFLGMMGQIPLVVITKFLYRKYPGSSIGNIIFWISFCFVGQPMAMLLYTIDYKYASLHQNAPQIFDNGH